ncbi:MAG TPA: FAD-dependent oxidoreductase, partial [Dermatophilaceae bacterium]|nr:FAD-dependent oxidoreductase [Dermatophilaceae bacterium]
NAVFDDLDQGRLMADPSFLVSLPTVTDPGLAPPAGGTAYLLFPAPNLDQPRPLDWTTLRGPYRDHVLRVAERAGYHLDIEAECLVTPADWLERGYPAGTPFSAAHTFGQTGPFRTPNRLAPGVVLAGAGTTPGVGVPMVLISGRLAAQRVLGSSR